jgi:nucleoside phosphorylase
MTEPLDAPILEHDPTVEAVIEPKHSVAAFDLPRHVVLCYFRDALGSAAEELGGRTIGSLGSEMGLLPVVEIAHAGRRLALVQAGVGAPLAAGWLEELIGLGGRAFVAVGGAGVLVPELAMGHIIVPTAAVRDEGTSYHYLPASREVSPTDVALAAIVATLERHEIPYVTGKTWTTDALYRETKGKVARRAAEGCLAVEMEAAAFFAVARFRGVSFGQILYAGDDLSGDVWDSRGWMEHAGGRRLLLDLGMEAVLAIEAGEDEA